MYCIHTFTFSPFSSPLSLSLFKPFTLFHTFTFFTLSQFFFHTFTVFHTFTCSRFHFFIQGFAPGDGDLLPSSKHCLPCLGSTSGSHTRAAGSSMICILYFHFISLIVIFIFGLYAWFISLVYIFSLYRWFISFLVFNLYFILYL